MPTTKKYKEHDEALPTCVIVDIDGTVADMAGRKPFDWAKCVNDQPIKHIVKLVKMYYKTGHKIIFISGRDGSIIDQTRKWIENHIGKDIAADCDIHLKTTGSYEPDTFYKYNVYQKHIEGVYNVELVLEDRDRVVDLWRNKANVPCLQVDYGNF
jgi:hypothetical protein